MIKREDIDENVLISLDKRNENWQIVEDIKNDLVTQKENFDLVSDEITSLGDSFDSHKENFNTYKDEFDSHKLDYANLVNEVNAKANKQQEEWITPTLLNGWSMSNGFPVGYYKGEDGVVRFRGMITGGTTGGACMIMPDGYGPDGQQIDICRTSFIAAPKFAEIYVKADNSIVINSDTNAHISLSGLSYRAKEV